MRGVGWGAALVVVALAAPAGAEQKVQASRSARGDSRVEIDVPAGEVRITGWDKEEVSVSGTLCERATGISLSGSGRVVRIEVDAEDPHRCPVDLDIRLPRASRVQVETHSAGVTAKDLSGTFKGETVAGSMSVTGSLKEAELATVSGNVEVSGSVPSVHAEAVNGSVTVKGVGAEVEASTVNGALTVEAGSLNRGRLETVSGKLSFVGGLLPTASLEVESVSGNVDLAFRGTLDATITVDTFSGRVTSELLESHAAGSPAPNAPDADEDDEDLPEREGHSFVFGSGGAEVGVETLSGNVHLHPAAAK